MHAVVAVDASGVPQWVWWTDHAFPHAHGTREWIVKRPCFPHHTMHVRVHWGWVRVGKDRRIVWMHPFVARHMHALASTTHAPSKPPLPTFPPCLDARGRPINGVPLLQFKIIPSATWMWHGTNPSAAQHIITSATLRASVDGMLGAGVYMTPALRKACRFAVWGAWSAGSTGMACWAAEGGEGAVVGAWVVHPRGGVEWNACGWHVPHTCVRGHVSGAPFADTHTPAVHYVPSTHRVAHEEMALRDMTTFTMFLFPTSWRVVASDTEWRRTRTMFHVDALDAS
jgi:hypothetical protein